MSDGTLRNPVQQAWFAELSRLERYNAWLYRSVSAHVGKRVLEIGCGNGNLTKFFANADRVVAIDHDPSFVLDARRRFGGLPNVQVLECDFPAQYESTEHFDTVVCMNVLEHVRDEEAFLWKAWGALLSGGKLILLVPAHQWLFGTLDHHAGHLRRYSAGALRTLLERVGFTVASLNHLNVMGALGWFLTGRVLRQTVPSRISFRAFNALTGVFLSFERILRAAVPLPVGLSLLAVAQKRDS